MERVAIIGIPGAGKSTFANKLSELTDLPVTHLDKYYNDESLGYQQDHDSWITMATELEDQDKWIIDGNFGATMAHRFERADTVFWFNMPTYVALRGIYMRRFDKQGRLGMPAGWKEKIDWDFFWDVAKYNHKHHKGLELLTDLKDTEVVVFKSHKQVNEYLANFQK